MADDDDAAQSDDASTFYICLPKQKKKSNSKLCASLTFHKTYDTLSFSFSCLLTFKKKSTLQLKPIVIAICSNQFWAVEMYQMLKFT